MKVCFVIQGLKKGGAERVLSLLANKFCEKGHKVTIALTETDENIAYPINKDIRVINILKKSKGSKSNLLIKRLSIIRNLRMLFKEERPDVCISFLTKVNIYSIISGIGLNFPVIISERNNPLVDPRSRLTRILRDIFYPFADGYVFQTQFAADYFSKKIGKRSVVIPNPLTDEVNNVPEKNQKRKEIIAVCRLEEQKNLPMLIKAFSNISKKHPDYTLIIYGEGSMRNYLEQLIKSLNISGKVKLKGKKDNVIQLMSESEIFVLSSNYEGMPNALAEAMAVGLPCISTDCPSYGSRFLIENKENGLLIPVGDQNGLEKAICKLIDDPVLSLKISNNAKLIRKELSINKIFNLWFRYIERIHSK